MPLNPKKIQRKKRTSKKRTSKKRKSYKKKTPQSGGSDNSSTDGLQPTIKIVNKTLRYTTQSSRQMEISEDINALLDKVNTFHTIGGIIIDPSINQFATTEGNIKVIKPYIEKLQKVTNKLQLILEEGKEYIIQRNTELTRKGVINNDKSLKRFWENWQKKKNPNQQSNKRSGRKTSSKSK